MAVTREEIIEALEGDVAASRLPNWLRTSRRPSACPPLLPWPWLPPGCRLGGAAAEEKTDFDVVLEGFGDNKIAVIKVVRDHRSLGPEGGQGGRRGPPGRLSRRASTSEGRGDQAKLEEAGAAVTLKQTRWFNEFLSRPLHCSGLLRSLPLTEWHELLRSNPARMVGKRKQEKKRLAMQTGYF